MFGGSRLPKWVKLRRTQYEHMFSALPLRADIAQQSRHVRFVPKPEVPSESSLALRSQFGLPTRYQFSIRDTLIEGFSHFVTSMTAPIASGWSVAGWGLHPLESAAFARRTPEADIQTAWHAA